jgi:hypothetical protein
VNTVTVINYSGAAVLGLVGLFLVWRCWPHHRSEQAWPAVRQDDGPDALQAMNAHLDTYVLADRQLLAHFHPDTAAGLDRLRRAVRDDQNNTAEED